jgi:hypothetical protein
VATRRRLPSRSLCLPKTRSDSIGEEVHRGSALQDVPERLDWARMRRILCQSEMRPDLVSSIGVEDPAQVAFAQDYDMIQALPRIEPISLSGCPFCQGDLGAIG